MAYASLEDVQLRMTREMTDEEQETCEILLEDIALIIDSHNAEASEEAKKMVSCRAIIRMFGDGSNTGIPVGATQGSVAALGYSQSWTVGGGSTGELYLTKLEKQLLGGGSKIGSYSPVQELVCEEA